MPPHAPRLARKSLFGKENTRGLPIGNLTSQFWGNVYLNELDHFVKRRLGCRYYVRYVDDLVFLSSDPAELVRVRGAIETFVRLGLALRGDGCEPQPVARGIDFVGWKTWWNRRLPRRRTLGNLRVRLEAFERTAVRSVRGGLGRRIDVGSQDAVARVERLRATVASYSGHLRHGQAWRAWARAWEAHRWLGALFAQRGWQVDARWPLRRIARVRRFRAQYWQLVRRAGPGCLVFCQVGRFVEFRGPQRSLATQALGLRTTYLPRAGYGLAVGFPVWPCRRYEERALGRGLTVAVVRESGQRPSRCRRRRPVALLVPGRSNSCPIKISGTNPGWIWSPVPLDRPYALVGECQPNQLYESSNCICRRFAAGTRALTPRISTPTTWPVASKSRTTPGWTSSESTIADSSRRR